MTNDLTSQNKTDLGNAERLIALHGDNLHFCPARKSWFCWDGKRWALDVTHAVQRRALHTVRELYRQAADLEDDTVRKSLISWALRSESRGAIDGMVSLASHFLDIVIRQEQLDAEPWLLNVENGTLDLKSGLLREHRREDLITRLCPVDYDANVSGERWLSHLDRFLPAEDVRRQVQRDLGRGLVGTTLEESLSIWYGTGANGKTTTSRAIMRVLGDYADRAAPNLLIQSRHERHPTELADLAGKRLVFSVEVDQGRKLAEALVKDLTGGDRKKARFMHQDFFAFDQTANIVLVVNHQPIISGGDEGIWRRVRLIPWEHRIPDAEKRPQDDVLNDLNAESPAILNWLLEGLKDWQQDHTWLADAVKAANEQYRAEMDVLGNFVAECCVKGPRYTVAKGDLYNAYEDWCKQNSEEALSKKAFGMRLKDQGIGEHRNGHGGPRRCVGIGLVTKSEVSFDDEPPF